MKKEVKATYRKHRMAGIPPGAKYIRGQRSATDSQAFSEFMCKMASQTERKIRSWAPQVVEAQAWEANG